MKAHNKGGGVMQMLLARGVLAGITVFVVYVIVSVAVSL